MRSGLGQLPLSNREWSGCGAFDDRDLNAARNLRRYALDWASCARIDACGEEGSGAGLTASVKPASRKQESAMSHLGVDGATAKLEGMTDLGKVLVGLGGFVVLVGLLIMLLGKVGLPLGRLPGDIVYRGKNTVFYFPLVTSILLSVALSLVLYAVSRFRR